MREGYSCLYCSRQGYEKLYYDSSVFWIAQFEGDEKILVILNEHRHTADQWEINEMLRVCNRLFNMKTCKVEFLTENISGHFHFYLAPVKSPIVTTEEVTDEAKKTNKKPKKKDKD